MFQILMLLLGLFLIYEGIGFLFPVLTRKTVHKIATLTDSQIRLLGWVLIGAGIFILFIFN